MAKWSATTKFNSFTPKPSLIYNVGGRFGIERVKRLSLVRCTVV